MTKAEIVSKMAQEAKITKVAAGEALDAFLQCAVESLNDENKLSIIGCGTFKKAHRKAREGRNPQTGKTIQISAYNTVTFKAGKALKEAVA